MKQIINVLDKGYVAFVESWGCDERIIESARMSTNKGFQGWDKDEGLLKYLYKNKHFTPFEMCGLTLEIKAPIFIFREWHRHRTQSYNEMSGRYTVIPNENYEPTIERLVDSSKPTNNKQAQGSGKILTAQTAMYVRVRLRSVYRYAEEVYNELAQLGVAKELARLPVPVARYSKMRASANLRNWLQFLSLRLDEHAMFEIQEYSSAVYKFIKQEFPRTAEIFRNSFYEDHR